MTGRRQARRRGRPALPACGFGLVGLVVAALTPAVAGAEEPGRPFRDCPQCPEMVGIPTGSFTLGATAPPAEAPAHRVILRRPFALAVTETTWQEWEACVADRGCPARDDDHGWGRGPQPVINVTWDDARRYAAWLADVTGQPYRLPTEAEWEYAARARTSTPYWWGNDVGENHANCRHCGSRWSARQAAPVKSFRPNPFGLHDMNGNVWEWVADCWTPNHVGAPGDGAVRAQTPCPDRVIRGGAWYYIPALSRASARVRQGASLWSYTVGFRVARDL